MEASSNLMRFSLRPSPSPFGWQFPVPSCRMSAYLRSYSDCRAIIAKAAQFKRIVLLGASFVAMEVAAVLIQRKLKVEVVAPEAVPMATVLGPQVGDYLPRLHEPNGVVFHLQQSVVAIDARKVTLKDGTHHQSRPVSGRNRHQHELILPSTPESRLIGECWLTNISKTSIAGIFAAGDIVGRPDPLSGDHIRVEHWIVAERQGQTAARNILGRREERFDAVPFFWTSQFDFSHQLRRRC
jgi:apoptosis-inducing factor 3